MVTNKKLERDKKTQDGREKKKKYLAKKERVIENEKENVKSLVLLQTTNGWYKMFGHSAVLYAYEIGPRLKQKPKLLPDTDFQFQSEDGVVSIRNIEKFKEDMKTLKATLKYEQDGLIIYNLGYNFTLADINRMKKTDELKWEKANKLIVPEVKMPAYRMDLKKLLKTIHENARKMDIAARDLIGRDMDETVGQMEKEFFMMANGWIPVEEYMNKNIRRLNELKAALLVVMDLKLINPDRTYRIGLAIENVMKRTIKVLRDEQRNLNHGE